jgi:hypothetical protein
MSNSDFYVWHTGQYTGSTLPARTTDIKVIVQATGVRSGCEPLSGRIKEQSYVKHYNCSF